MRKAELLLRLASVRPELEAEGIRHMALFGSRARGDHAPQSDVDLLLDVDPESRFSILNLVGVEHIVENVTGIPANAFMRRSMDEEFRSSIGKDLVEVF